MFCCTNVDAAVVGGKGFVVQHSWCVPTIEDVRRVKCVARRPIDGYRKCDEEVSRVDDEMSQVFYPKNLGINTWINLQFSHVQKFISPIVFSLEIIFKKCLWTDRFVSDF